MGTASERSSEAIAAEALLEAMADPCFGLDRELRITFWNRAQVAITGVEASQAVGRDVFELIGSARDSAVHRMVERVLETGRPEWLDYRSVQLAPGRCFSLGCFPMREGVCLVARDISERVRIEEALREREAELARVVEQKELLLRELHHRTNNNVQLLTSLVRAQALQADDESARQLQTLERRLQAIQLLQSHLQRVEEPVSRVDGAGYLCALGHGIVSALSPPGQGSLELDVAPFAVHSDQALRLGLIVNELLTNAVQHARCEGVLLAARDVSGLLSVEVCDRGPGLPPDVDEMGRMGLDLVRALVEEMGGRVEILAREGGGLCVRVDRIRLDARSLDA